MDLKLGMNAAASLLLLTSLIGTTHTTHNVSMTEETRNPRVSGRIVKLYSGIKPEPILCPNEGFQPDPVNCAIFYRCVKGANEKYTVFRYECGPGTVYDPDTEICNHPRSTKRINCGGIVPPSTEQTFENEIDGSRNEIAAPISTKLPAYLDIINKKDASFITTKLPNLVAVNKNEIPTPISTKQPIYTETTHKEAGTHSTKYPWSVSLENRIASSISTSYPWSTRQEQRVTRSPVVRQQNSQTGPQCTNEGFMGDTENCRKFYRCVGNGRGGFMRYEFSCSELTIWDDETQACNHAWAVKKRRCGRGTSDDDQTPASSNENEIDAITTQVQTQISYGSKVNQVQTQISNGPVRQNQTQIHYNDNGNKKQDSEVRQNQTQISHGSAVSQVQTQIDHGSNGFQSQLQIDHSKQSSQSQTQVHETTTKKESNSPQQDTEKPISNDVNNENGNNQCTESGFMGDSNDCKKFYRCVENGRGGFIKYEFTCGEGTVWDPDVEACNHPSDVKNCKNKAPSESTNQGTTTTTVKPQDPTTAQTTMSDDEDVGYGNQNQQDTPTSTTQSKPLTTTEVTTTTTQSSTSGENVCQSSGFMGDSQDCKKFYRCVDNGKGGYTKYEYKCGEGTVWDSDIESCNHAWAVKNCGGTSNNQNIEDTTTTRGSTTTTVTLVQTTPPMPTENDEDVGYGPSQNEQTTTTTVKTTVASEEQNSNEDNKCNTSGFMGDKNDCKKFYRCVDDGNGGYTRYEFSCGEGTVWDSKIEACNHARDVENCGGGGTATTSVPNSTTQSTSPVTDEEIDYGYPGQSQNEVTTTTSSSTSVVTSTTTKSPGQSNQCKSDGFMGDKNDCKKFYRCVDDGKGGFTRYEFNCGEGTVWDESIDACNHPSSKNTCGSTETQSNTSPTEQTTTTKSTTNTEETPDKGPTSSTTEETTSSNNGDTCSSEGFFGNSNDCKKFYRCVDDGKGGYTKYDFTCGEGTSWNQQSQTCDHESSEMTCSQGSDISHTQKPDSQSESTTQSESTSGPSTEGSQSTTEKSESTTSSNKDQCTSEGFYANSNDCKKFYRCVSNDKGGYTKYDFTCGQGTVWVQEIQACDHDNDISSCSSQSGSTSSSSEMNQDQTTSTASTTSGESSTTEKDNNTGSSDQSEPPAQSDSCTSEGFYANKNDCRQFYRCVDNGKGGFTKYDFTCGEGTAWDADIQACNHINEVENCQGSQQGQSENQPEPDKTDESTSETSGPTSSTTASSAEPDGGNKQPTGTDECEQEGYFGDSNNCQKFYRCVDNGKGGLTKYDYTCGEGTIWDQDVLTCNHPRDVVNPSCTSNTDSSSSSDGSSSTTTSTTSSGSSSSSSGSSSTTESSGQGSSDCSQESSQKPNNNVTCTKAGFYADPNDCKKFYRCVDWDNNGQRFSVYHFDCGEGTIWDPALETCNHEESVYPPRDCSGKESQSQNASDETTTTTTTEQSTTTTDQSTTEESTTTEQTTTQGSTTTEATTTEQTTTEESTTQQSSTTTQQSTTSEKTTTQQSTTSEQTTESTTTTTTEKSTTEQSTTEQSTTEQSTTEQSTTEQGTTEQSTTEQSTTEQSTTEQSTTEQSTTEQSTTEQSTTEQSTTEHSTTELSTTEQSTTEQSTTEQSTTEQSTTEQSTTEQSTTEQSTTEQTTEESTTQESSTTEESSSTTEQSSDSSTTEAASSGSKDCPETEDDQYLYVCPTSFRRHPKYCNMFYQCTEDNDSHELKLSVFKCPNNTIYDEKETQCVEESKADKKCDGEIAQRRRVKRLGGDHREPITVGKEKHVCPTTGHYPFEKSECSPGFLKCDRTKSGKLRGYVYQCPQGYVYWSISRRCEARSNVRDCKLSANDWSGRWEVPFERKNVAT